MDKTNISHGPLQETLLIPLLGRAVATRIHNVLHELGGYIHRLYALSTANKPDGTDW